MPVETFKLDRGTFARRQDICEDCGQVTLIATRIVNKDNIEMSRHRYNRSSGQMRRYYQYEYTKDKGEK